MITILELTTQRQTEYSAPSNFEEIRKRDGRVVPFDRQKITEAIFKAAKAVGGEDRTIAENLTQQVVQYLLENNQEIIPTVEGTQDTVEKILIENGHARTAKAYILYRSRRTQMREGKSALMDGVKEILMETSRENANISNSPSAKMLQIAMAASKNYYLSNLLPEDSAWAHQEASIHIHDLDYYAKTLNCLQIDLKKLLHEGFHTGNGWIRPPQRVYSAAALSAIILQSNQNDMYGGQSFSHFDRDMGEVIRGFAHQPSQEETFQAMEGLVYNLNTMHSRAGAQVPFSSINFGTDTTKEGRMVTRALLEAFNKGLGRGENPVFPNLVFRVKEGVNFEPEDPNYDLFRLAMKVASHRLNPTFSFMDASFNQKYGDEVSYMGCRTRTIANRHGKEISAGRGNIASVSINLPRLALKAKEPKAFFVELDQILRLSVSQLLHRFEVLSELKIKDLPFLMGQSLYMGSEKLECNEPIREIIKHGTLSIGFIGLAEALIALVNYHHGDSQEARQLGLSIVEHMWKRTQEFCEEYDLNFALYATPAEGLSGRFIDADRKLFGVLPGITDKEYYTNSYHLPVNYLTSLYEKINIEGEYHSYCNGGHISYVELSSPPRDNIDAIEKILRHMAACNLGYGGINYPIDECTGCSFSGLIPLACPQCGETEIRRIRRITGYLSTQDRFNGAKQAELRDRKSHIFNQY
ncbi:anaerobic ribonucleoside-triphosphate reductase [Candidatus Contubernalis alkalaceticus]|uniref:anaerobic ribonucleoside-triphosphate reductase n=1 Tax=Candidatus Contubernalis alkaliaceticus TaxID=338645 RepID=UPI002A4E1C66|nr:anaerobic ribonucleoside-triphosphate reductase [Candidatus Contubernalis alkalaceticus]